jgi:hypothetical protein
MTVDYGKAPEPPTSATLWVANDVPKLLQARRWKRVQEYESKGVEVASMPDELRLVDDERNDVTYLYRHADGRLFERQPRHPDITTRPDLVAAAFDGDTLELVELHQLDVDVYELEVGRHRAELERAESERLAALEADRRARESAPRHPVCTSSSWTLSELLERIAETNGNLTLHNDRVLLELPRSPHLIGGSEYDYGRAVNELRALIVATKAGTITVRCDVADCDHDAVTIAAAGAYLCAACAAHE